MQPLVEEQHQEEEFIFRPYITRPDGTKDWARNHGKKAWKIPIRGKKDKNEN